MYPWSIRGPASIQGRAAAHRPIGPWARSLANIPLVGSSAWVSESLSRYLDGIACHGLSEQLLDLDWRAGVGGGRLARPPRRGCWGPTATSPSQAPPPPRPAPIAPARLLVPGPPPRVKARQRARPDHSMVRAPEITRDVRRCGMSALRARDGRGECAPPRPCQVLLRGDGGVWFRWRLVMLTRRAASGPLGCPGRVRLQDRLGGRLGETRPIRRRRVSRRRCCLRRRGRART